MDTNIITLGARLQAIASLIKKGSILGDIGTDHAYLPVYLVQQAVIQKAIGVDVHDGPYESALQTVQTYGLDGIIDIRKGNGLIPLQPGEVNVLVLAGMGGNTILQILNQSRDVMMEIQEMVLQPQGAEGKVRRELVSNGWRIKEERLVEEEGRIYGLIHFTRTEGLNREDVEGYVHDFLNRLKSGMNIEPQRKIFATEIQQIEENQQVELADCKDIISNCDDNYYKSNIEENILRNKVEKFIWDVGPLIVSQEVKTGRGNELLHRLIVEQIQRLERVTEEMQHAVREEVKEQAQEIYLQITVWEMIKQCLFQ